MFEGSNIFILSDKGEVYRLDVDKSTQTSICKMFSDSVEKMKNKDLCDFEVNYKLEDNNYKVTYV